MAPHPQTPVTALIDQWSPGGLVSVRFSEEALLAASLVVGMAGDVDHGFPYLDGSDERREYASRGQRWFRLDQLRALDAAAEEYCRVELAAYRYATEQCELVSALRDQLERVLRV